jgi:hypothetical protein
VQVVQVPDAAQVPQRGGVLAAAVLAGLPGGHRLHPRQQPAHGGGQRVLGGVVQGGVAAQRQEGGGVVVAADQADRLLDEW